MNQEFVQTNKYHIKRRRRLDDSVKQDLLDLTASDDGICNLTNWILSQCICSPALFVLRVNQQIQCLNAIG